MDGWRRAVRVAEEVGREAEDGTFNYWPVHLNDDGTITASLPPDPDTVVVVDDTVE